MLRGQPPSKVQPAKTPTPTGPPDAEPEDDELMAPPEDDPEDEELPEDDPEDDPEEDPEDEPDDVLPECEPEDDDDLPDDDPEEDAPDDEPDPEPPPSSPYEKFPAELLPQAPMDGATARAEAQAINDHLPIRIPPCRRRNCARRVYPHANSRIVRGTRRPYWAGTSSLADRWTGRAMKLH
jgi:hypothetical protein